MLLKFVKCYTISNLQYNKYTKVCNNVSFKRALKTTKILQYIYRYLRKSMLNDPIKMMIDAMRKT